MRIRADSANLLLEQAEDLLMQGYNVLLLDPLPILENQKGHSCKLISTSNALNYYYAADKLAKKPLPTNKRSHEAFYNGRHNLSARQVAKQHGITRFGEIYSADGVLKLIAALGDATADDTIRQAKVECKRFVAGENGEYINFLKTMVEQSAAPIIFFDCDNDGFPVTTGNGDREHSAIVLGYVNQPDTGEQYFVLGHWGTYYIVDAYDLADSAAILEHIRRRESYLKITIDEDGKHFSDLDILDQNGVGEHTHYDEKLAELNKLITPEQRKQLMHNEVIEIPDRGIKAIKKIGGSDEAPQPGFNLTVIVIHPAPKSELKHKQEYQSPKII